LSVVLSIMLPVCKLFSNKYMIVRHSATYYGNKGKILASLPYFQSVDPEESPLKYLQNWQDMSIIKHDGRAFDADKELIDKDKTFVFPRLNATSLAGKSVFVPDSYSDKPIKLIAFALNTYGENASKTWLDPFVEKYGLNHPQIHIIEICFLEWKWLSIFSNSIVASMKTSREKAIKKNAKKRASISEQQKEELTLINHAYDNIVISVGTIMVSLTLLCVGCITFMVNYLSVGFREICEAPQQVHGLCLLSGQRQQSEMAWMRQNDET
jgi:hypothetical protein